MNVHGHTRIAVSAILILGATAHAQTEPAPAIAPAPAPTPAILVTPPALAPIVMGPTDEEVDERGNLSTFATGTAVFLGSYTASVIVAATSEHRGDDRLYVPVLGPWLDLGERGACPVAHSACDNETTDKVLIVADGIFQAAGLLAMVDGMFASGHHHARVVDARRDDRQIHVTPLALGHGAPGFSVSGHF